MKKLLLFLVISIAALGVYADNFAVETTDHLHVWAEFPDTIYADSTSVFYIKVYEHDDDDIDYTAFNMEFVLPEGFRINQVKEGRSMVNDIHLSDRAFATHSISCSLKDGYDLRIISTSSQNDLFYKDDEDGNPLDELFTIGLVAEPSLGTGKYTASMEGIKFCLKNADARIPAAAPVEYTLNVVNPDDTQTSLAETGLDDSGSEHYYDLQGRMINASQAHGNIVVSKGKKIIVK